MPVELTHLGEDLVAALLESLSQRNALSTVVCAVSGRPLSQDVHEVGLGDSFHFSANDANAVVQIGERSFSCDGEQKVDVLCAGSTTAIAFEAKLGLERMGTAEFGKRYCMPCEQSRHADDRISGSMVAVLERSLPFEDPCNLVARIQSQEWQVARPWWLVLRQRIVDRWLKSGVLPVRSARILSFDALAESYGSMEEFDQLVQRVVGTGFSDRWGLSLRPTS